MAFRAVSLHEERLYISRYDPAIGLVEDHDAWKDAGYPKDYAKFFVFREGESPTIFYLKPLSGHLANEIQDRFTAVNIGNDKKKNDDSAIKMNSNGQNWEATRHALKRVENFLDENGVAMELTFQDLSSNIRVVREDCMVRMFSRMNRNVAFEIGNFVLSENTLSRQEQKNS